MPMTAKVGLRTTSARLVVAHLMAGLLICTGVAVAQPASTSPSSAGGRAFTVGPVTAAPGAKVSGRLDVPAGVDAATFVPITVVNGRRSGPTLAIIAGIHGSETTPILALQNLVTRLDPEALTGTVVLVHVANIPSFLGRSIYVSPVDRKNLNRQFPGRADGTVSERIAHVLLRDVLTVADAVIDVHSGDANEDLRPWTGYYARYGAEDVIRRSREMAVAFGLEYVVEFPFSPKPDEPTLYTGSTAVQMGKPAFDVEVGRRGQIEPANTALIVDGLLDIARHLGMLAGSPRPRAATTFVTGRHYLETEHDGLFYPLVKAGDTVEKGAPLGYVTDFFGRRVQDLTAPASGIVLVIVATPAVNQGEEIVTLATAFRR